MPPQESLKMRYHVRYPHWSSMGYLVTFLDDYIGKPKDLKSVGRELVRKQDSAEVKVRKLYEAVQEQIQNLSDQERYTKKERKREGIKERKTARDVWKYRYGTSEEITLLFAALCRAAGLTADVVLVMERESQFYDSELHSWEDLDGWLVIVELPSGNTYFDPGTRFAPMGWVPWQKQAVQGARFRKTRAVDVQVPLQEPETNLLHQRITLTLQPSGSARVHLATTYSGEVAVQRRNDFFELSKEQRERKLQKALEEIFPAARNQRVDWEGMDDASDKATVSYWFDLSDLAKPLGSRLLVQPILLKRRSAFLNWERTHSVYLRRFEHVLRDIRMLPPSGYELEHLPEKRKFTVFFGEYESSVSKEDDVIVCHTRLTTQAAMLQTENYPDLKRFYDQIAASERTHLVLRESTKK